MIMAQPNLYKIESDLKNLGRNLDEMRVEARRREEVQTGILKELSAQTERLAKIMEKTQEQDKRMEFFFKQLSGARRELSGELDALNAKFWKISGVAAFLAGSAGFAAEKLF